MEEEIKRPGGLTALAVINFIFAGLGLITSVFSLFSRSMIENISTTGMPEAQRAKIEAFQRIDPSLYNIMIFIGLISSLLLLLSGIGYLKQKRVLGRTMGNVYGFYGILSIIINYLLMPKELFGIFSAVIGIAYPVITLILLDTAFKNDLNN
jgi:hypothetical protein